MSDENYNQSPSSGSIDNKYRLVIMNDETFEEIGSYRLSRLNIYMLICSILVIVVLFVVSLIIFTPMKQYIPGYGEANQDRKAVSLSQQVDSLAGIIEARNLYIDNIRRVLAGDFDTTRTYEEGLLPSLDSANAVDPIAEEIQLREDVEKEDALNFGRALKTNYRPGSKQNEDLYESVFVPPINGFVTDVFQPERQHYGIDVAAPKNTPIKAIMDGIVVCADWTLETGYIIMLQHDNDLISFYKHNSVLLKKVGTFVKAGEAIAIIGNTGELSDGPHLHFELWHNSKPVNPGEYINF